MDGQGRDARIFPHVFKNLDFVLRRARWQLPVTRARIACPPICLLRLQNGDRQRSESALALGALQVLPVAWRRLPSPLRPRRRQEKEVPCLQRRRHTFERAGGTRTSDGQEDS